VAAAIDDDDASSQGKIVIDLRVPDHEKVKLLPPPKWKFFCILFPLIFLITYLEDLSGIVPYVLGKTGFTVNFMVFCIMIVNIYVFTYSCLSFVPWLCNITLRGESYGVTKWMKQPRWAPACYASSSFGWQAVGTVIEIFEDGFQIFDCGWHKGENDGDDPDLLEGGEEDDLTRPEVHFRNSNDKMKALSSRNTEVVAHYEFIIDPAYETEYDDLCERTDSILRAKGVKEIIRHKKQDILPDDIDADDDDETDENKKDGGGDDNGDVEEPQLSSTTHNRRGMLQRMTFNFQLGGIRHGIKLVFHNMDDLNQWLACREREITLKQIKPLLMKPHVMTLQDARKLPDLFTDMVVPQGFGTPDHLPKKWKVANVTIVGFWIQFVLNTVWWPHYSNIWFDGQSQLGMAGGKYPGMLALDLALLVAMFMYLTEPCLMYLFAPWLLRKKTEMDTQEPWRTLNDGFTSRWVQGILTIAFFGIFVVLYASWGPWTGIPPP